MPRLESVQSLEQHLHLVYRLPTLESVRICSASAYTQDPLQDTRLGLSQPDARGGRSGDLGGARSKRHWKDRGGWEDYSTIAPPPAWLCTRRPLPLIATQSAQAPQVSVTGASPRRRRRTPAMAALSNRHSSALRTTGTNPRLSILGPAEPGNHRLFKCFRSGKGSAVVCGLARVFLRVFGRAARKRVNSGSS